MPTFRCATQSRRSRCVLLLSQKMDGYAVWDEIECAAFVLYPLVQMGESMYLSIGWRALLGRGVVFRLPVAWCYLFNHLVAFTKIAACHKEWLVFKVARVFMVITSIQRII